MARLVNRLTASRALTAFQRANQIPFAQVPSCYQFKSLDGRSQSGYTFTIAFTEDAHSFRHLNDIPDYFEFENNFYPVFKRTVVPCSNLLGGKKGSTFDLVTNGDLLLETGNETIDKWVENMPGIYSWGIEIDYERPNSSV